MDQHDEDDNKNSNYNDKEIGDHLIISEPTKDDNAPLFWKDLTIGLYVISRNRWVIKINECHQIHVSWPSSNEVTITIVFNTNNQYEQTFSGKNTSY